MFAELELLTEADRRARDYVTGAPERRVFPDQRALDALSAFDEPLPDRETPPMDTLALLDDVGSPATAVSNGPNYFGFVIGATLPVAAAAERLVLAWDQSAAAFDSAPGAATLERVAGLWVLEALDLPRDSAVGFGTSATACGLTCLAAARRELLARRGWDFDRQGLIGAPVIRVVVSDTAHITVLKALRVLGFGLDRLAVAPTRPDGSIDPDGLPDLDATTILCLQAGEVNTGSFDPFAELLPRARSAGTWVHVDGAFGMWARAAPALKHLTAGIELADSWTADGHKWLNTPYDSAMAICRHPQALAAAMNSDAAYATADPYAQKNLTLEFSRRARGVAIWAALRSLGCAGVAAMVERHCTLARRIADGLRMAGYEVINDVVLNQVLVRGPSDDQTIRLREAALATGRLWFGTTVWRGRPAFRLSVSSWRTTESDVDRAVAVLSEALTRSAQADGR